MVRRRDEPGAIGACEFMLGAGTATAGSVIGSLLGSEQAGGSVQNENHHPDQHDNFGHGRVAEQFLSKAVSRANDCAASYSTGELPHPAMHDDHEGINNGVIAHRVLNVVMLRKNA